MLTRGHTLICSAVYLFPTDKLAQTALFSDMYLTSPSTDLCITPVCNPTCPHTAPSVWPTPQQSGFQPLTLTAMGTPALPAFVQGSLCIDHCQCGSLLPLFSTPPSPLLLLPCSVLCLLWEPSPDPLGFQPEPALALWPLPLACAGAGQALGSPRSSSPLWRGLLLSAESRPRACAQQSCVGGMGVTHVTVPGHLGPHPHCRYSAFT